MATLHLKIVTPEKEILDQEVSQVNVPTSQGILGILPNHADLMAKLSPGLLEIKTSGKTEELALGFGFIQVSQNNLSIMSDSAEKPSDIDEKAVEEAKKRAEQALEHSLSSQEQAETLAIIERTTVQLKIKRRHRSI